MCGIFCAISSETHVLPSEDLQQRLHNRGPDSTQTILKEYNNVRLTLCSTVLSLRGSKTVTQPFADDREEYVLCWNGEAWSIDDEPQTGNDTAAVHKLLMGTIMSTRAKGGLYNPASDLNSLAAALSRVAGPYAFVFYDALRHRLFFGRDFLGRRSLMFRTTHSRELLLSSVSGGDAAGEWFELEADGVYCIYLDLVDLQTEDSEPTPRRFGGLVADHAPYHFTTNDGYGTETTNSVIPRLSLNKTMPAQIAALDPSCFAVSCLEELLRESILLRVLNVPELPTTSNEQTLDYDRAKVAVLFSGGLDCTVLACVAHHLLPLDEPVDLLNVAFENPRIHKSSTPTTSTSASVYELCPDRITGRVAFSELQTTCPGRIWRFVAINIPYAETTEHRQNIISLMQPHNTEMDLSISLALYFAARGQGETAATSDGESISYTTSARVLLSGLGADELFGGYTRHATSYRHGGMLALLEELELDVTRLGKRNLGRDDRVMSHWSKEVRFPYLDEKLLAWALAAPVSDKCGFGEPSADDPAAVVDAERSGAIEPGKKVLRCLAWKLGMKGVAKEKKRAIQFGARTAKMETRKTKGTQLLG